MFVKLPEEIERIVWRFYFTINVVEEIKTINSVWSNPSDNLINICQDVGCAQLTHTDMEKALFNNNCEDIEIIYEECFNNICLNCVYHGFPCLNACIHGGLDDRLCSIWDMEFYKES